MSRPKDKLIDFFRSSPLVGIKLNLVRSKDTGRKIDLRANIHAAREQIDALRISTHHKL